MRRLLLLALLSSAAPLGAQSTNTGSVSQAVSNTIYQHAKDRGFSDEVAANTVAAASGRVAALAPTKQSWLEWFKSVAANEWPISLFWSYPDNSDGFFNGGGDGFDGGGATGSWDDEGQADCPDFDVEFDASGNLVVPAMTIPPGGPLTPFPQGFNTGIYQVSCGHFNVGSIMPCNGVGTFYASNHNMGGYLYVLHLFNLKRPTDPAFPNDMRSWAGVAWKNSGTSFTFRARAYFDSNNVLVNPTSSNASVNSAAYFTNAGGPNIPCPQNAQGGTFHFYAYGNSSTVFDQCVMYAPNYNLGPSGYAYPTKVSVPIASIDTWLTGNERASSCPIDPDFIRRIAQKLYDSAVTQPGYNGAPKDPARPIDNVRTDGKDPRGKDLKENPTTLPPAGPSEPPRNTDNNGSPSPTPSSTSGPDYTAPTIAEPVLSIPTIDWWPDLPSITVDLGSPTCPTYNLALPQWTEGFTIDSHCALIETNRALISALMIAAFTIMAVFVVLRA